MALYGRGCERLESLHRVATEAEAQNLCNKGFDVSSYAAEILSKHLHIPMQ